MSPIGHLSTSARRAFLFFIANDPSPDALHEVAERLGRNDIDGALRMVDRYTPRRLSNLICDPFVRDAFDRAERDDGACFAVPATTPPVLTGGDTKQLEMEMA
ncbi:hypothetical protein [Chelativorans alearense]|uniref:hypothetical protein n=1 Tax=Chelativorans alearense TaxID=2681495 RepID=UPI0013CFB25A|nr:hypothetical protein [Chelativorans alearense]